MTTTDATEPPRPDPAASVASSGSGWQHAGHLEEGLDTASPWYQWGPYVSERAWGSVREDYSADGDAWASFPHDHARSRAYRWNEDGMAGISDLFGRLNLGLALWNGRDPILKERMFGLTNSEGNHGEDVKEYWWYLDALPSSAWLRWRYHYPQAAFPVRGPDRGERPALQAASRSTSCSTPASSTTTATGSSRSTTRRPTRPTSWRGSPSATAGPRRPTIHVLPTLWFRNEWSWDPAGAATRPSRPAAGGTRIHASHPELGDYELHVGAGPGRRRSRSCCSARTRPTRRGSTAPAATTPYPKDGINDHVVTGADTVNPAGTGTKAAAWYRLTVEPGATAEIRLRLRPRPPAAAPGEAVDRRTSSARRSTRRWPRAWQRPTTFYADLLPARRDRPTRRWSCARRSPGCCGASSSTPTTSPAGSTATRPSPPPPSERLTGRNAGWRHFDAADILSMPDKWEYPWFAAWDLAFHTITLAHVDPAFAKYQLLVMCREWFQHPNGALPAYEWSFDDVNPPVHALAALAVWNIDGRRDTEFLKRIFHKLLLNFTWWLNRQDAEGNDLFSGGFLGLDNLSAFDRSHLPVAGQLEQSDATAWMYAYCMSMLAMADDAVPRATRPTATW